MISVAYAHFAAVTAGSAFAAASVVLTAAVATPQPALVHCHLLQTSIAALFPLPLPLPLLADQGQLLAGVVGVHGFPTVPVVLLALYCELRESTP